MRHAKGSKHDYAFMSMVDLMAVLLLSVFIAFVLSDPTNQPPKITMIDTPPNYVDRDLEEVYRFRVEDPEGSKVDLRLESDSDIAALDDEQLHLSIALASDQGEHHLLMRARDADGKEATLTLPVIVANKAPSIEPIRGVPLQLTPGSRTEIDFDISDPDQHEVTLKILESPRYVSVRGHTLIVEPPRSTENEIFVRVVAQDEFGAESFYSFRTQVTAKKPLPKACRENMNPDHSLRVVLHGDGTYEVMLASGVTELRVSPSEVWRSSTRKFYSGDVEFSRAMVQVEQYMDDEKLCRLRADIVISNDKPISGEEYQRRHNIVRNRFYPK